MKMQRLTFFVFVVPGFVVPVTYGQTPSATARDVISEIIEQAAKETSGQTPTPRESKTMEQMIDKALNKVGKDGKPLAQETQMEAWQTSADEFAKEVQRLFRKGAGETGLAERFHGKKIDWPGMLNSAQTERSKADPNVTLVAVWITGVPLVAPDGTPAYIGELALDIRNFVMPADKHVRVRATLAAVSTMPVINEKDHSKETVVMVETEGDGVIEPSVSAATPNTKDWCDTLLKTPVDKDLPEGYSRPQVSLTEMTAAERTGGMLCKISVMLQGPDPFNAIRFRVYENLAAAERGLKSLAKAVPDITVIDEKVYYHSGTVSESAPEYACMVYTAGNRTQTFVTCADQIEGLPIVVSGVSSQPREGNSYNTDLIRKAGRLLEAGIGHLRGTTLDSASDQIFGKDQKK